jgi:hypothetical protein
VAVTTSSKEQRLSDYLRAMTFKLTPAEVKMVSSPRFFLLPLFFLVVVREVLLTFGFFFSSRSTRLARRSISVRSGRTSSLRTIGGREVGRCDAINHWRSRKERALGWRMHMHPNLVFYHTFNVSQNIDPRLCVKSLCQPDFYVPNVFMPMEKRQARSSSSAQHDAKESRWSRRAYELGILCF